MYEYVANACERDTHREAQRHRGTEGIDVGGDSRLDMVGDGRLCAEPK